jgi:hypothetical protein
MDKKQREADLERCRELLVVLLLATKDAYLRSGAKALKHLEQMQSALRLATATSRSVGEWYTALAKQLRLGPPSSSTSSALGELVRHAHDTVGDRACLRMIAKEYTLLIALTRLAHEQRREERHTQSEDGQLEAAVEAARQAEAEGAFQVKPLEEMFGLEFDKGGRR